MVKQMRTCRLATEAMVLRWPILSCAHYVLYGVARFDIDAQFRFDWMRLASL